MFCYKILLEGTYCGSNSAWVGPPDRAGIIGVGRYITTEKGVIYAMAPDAQNVAEKYPNALQITRVGLAEDRLRD